MLLTQTDPSEVRQLLTRAGFTENDYLIKKVAPVEIPNYLIAADVALSLVKSTYATSSRSPTKIPEYLASGLPIIANRGVGDVDELLEMKRVGVLLDGFGEQEFADGLNQIDRIKERAGIRRAVPHGSGREI